MIYVTNLNNQLNLTYDTRKDVYAFDSIKSVSFSWDTNGDYYVIINFIANDKNNSLRIYLKDVDPTLSWVNTFAGATLAVNTIASWMDYVIEVNISEVDDSILIYGSDGSNNVPILVDSFGAVAIQDNGDFISVDSGAIQKTQNVLRITGTAGILAPGFSAMSFASVGTANATVDGEILKPGEVINIDAGGIDNVLGGLNYDTTNVGSELLIVTLI
jgi:hypothetical protein